MEEKIEHSEPIQDYFKFQCTRCGNCCTGDQEVFLNLYDLYKMARALGFLHTRDLFTKIVVTLERSQQDVFFPKIRFRTRPFKFCPFLHHESIEPDETITSCALHPDHKPLICHLAPVGRVLDMANNNDYYVFVKPAPDCPGVHSSRENLLSDWLEGLEQELEYQKTFFTILEHIKSFRWNKKQTLEALYFFDVTLPFPEIITSLQKQFVK